MDKMKIYLDNCCYNRPFDNQEQIRIRLETEAKLHIQSDIRNGVYSLVWSYMLDSENDDNPYEERRNSISPWKNIAENYCSSSADILTTGQDIMKLGIRAKDALHIACARASNCDYLITTDNGLTNKNVDGITIINPVDFVRIMEDISNEN